jgi:hypothetical protein
MLDKENNRDINIFAIQSLEPLIDDCIKNIMKDSEKFMSTFNLIEMFTLPVDIQEGQFKIIDAMTDYMNEQSARDAVKGKAVARIMKAYNYHAPNFQGSLGNLLNAI